MILATLGIIIFIFSSFAFTFFYPYILFLGVITKQKNLFIYKKIIKGMWQELVVSAYEVEKDFWVTLFVEK